MEHVGRALRARTRRLPAVAARNLRTYFARFGVADEAEHRRLARQVVAASAPGGDLVAVAEAEVAAWFAAQLGLSEQALRPGAIIATGRLAWFAVGEARRWPGCLLSEKAPVALTGALRRSVPALPPSVLNAPMPAADLSAATLPTPAILARLRLQMRAA
jgi:hypothetical protein